MVVWAEGEIRGASAPRLRDELVAAIDRRSTCLVVDLTGATFADATGPDVLMGALRAAELIGGDVRIVGAGRRLRELLAQGGLQPSFADGTGVAVADPTLGDHAPDEATRPSADGAGASDKATGEAALRAEITRLRETLQRRAVVEQAKGVLMLRYAVDDDEAFALLRAWSQNANKPLHTVAETLVHAICRGVRSSAYSTELVRWLELQLRHGPDARAKAARADADGSRVAPGVGSPH